MKKNWMLSVSAVLLSLTVSEISGAVPADEVKPPLKVYMARKIADQYDGRNFTEPALWKAIPASSDFGLFAFGRKDHARERTFFRAAYNNHGLFLELTCYEGLMAKLDFSKQTIERDKSSAVFSKPVIELFLDPLFSRKIAAHLVSNINGGIYDRLNTATEAWNLPFETLTVPHPEKGFYQMYFFIPWKDTSYENPEVYIFSMTPTANPVIGFNIAREQGVGNGEMSQWNPTLVQFMKPDQFGALVFSGEKNAREKMMTLFRDEVIAGGLDLQGGSVLETREMLLSILEHKMKSVEKMMRSLTPALQKQYAGQWKQLQSRFSPDRSLSELKALLNECIALNRRMEAETFKVLKNEIFDEI